MNERETATRSVHRAAPSASRQRPRNLHTRVSASHHNTVKPLHVAGAEYRLVHKICLAFACPCTTERVGSEDRRRRKRHTRTAGYRTRPEKWRGLQLRPFLQPCTTRASPRRTPQLTRFVALAPGDAAWSLAAQYTGAHIQKVENNWQDAEEPLN